MASTLSSSIRIWCLLILLTAPAAAELSEPERNFEHLWQTFDRNYALFGAKKVDWDALYAVYRPRVTATTTDDELFEVMASLLGHLNDNHVWLRGAERTFQSGILGEMEMEDFSLGVIKESYLGGEFEQRVGAVFTYGWLSETIGYFHFRNFGSLARSTAAIDEIIDVFRDARGIVVDVRANGGGDDRVGKAIADRFADRKRLYMTTRIRNGPDHDDFTAPKYWYAEPRGPHQFTGPVILLTHRYSISAAENFALAMRVLPNVTVVGDATSGVFADVYGDALPNGWRFSVSFKLFQDPTEFCWEGIGVPADLRQTNSKADVDAGRDRVIELAMALINSGALRPQDEPESLEDIRWSLVAELSDAIDRVGVEAAVAAYRRNRDNYPSDVYTLDEDELRELWEEYLHAGDLDTALALANLWTEDFGGSFLAWQRRGETQAALGRMDAARTDWETSRQVNRGSYPWERAAFDEIDGLLQGKEILTRALDVASHRDNLEEVAAAYRADRDHFEVDENGINRLGYRLLGSGRTDDAITVFALNTEAFPDSWNVHDSLAEGYWNRGDTKLAIASYEKSVELEPGNDNGHRMLAMIRDSLYVLPYPVGENYLLIQGNSGPFGHEGAAEFAFDFRMPIGTAVHAARPGEVIAVEESYADGTRQGGEENYVFVKHTDGTFGRYLNLKPRGALVEIGEEVERGQQIGISGHGGASIGAHLHFDVTEGCPESSCQTIPVRFFNTVENPLESGEFYRALPY